MKKVMIVVVLLLTTTAVSLYLLYGSSCNVKWVVDIDASTERIQEIPDKFKGRFSTLEQYKQFVREAANDLTITLHTDNTAKITGGWYGSTNKARWRTDDDFDYWIQTGGGYLGGALVGHGFNRTSLNTAELKYQLEWNENVATREWLVLRRE